MFVRILCFAGVNALVRIGFFFGLVFMMYLLNVLDWFLEKKKDSEKW